MSNVLNEREESLVNYLRNPLMYVARKSEMKKVEMQDFNKDEIFALYEKMDSYMKEVGENYRSLGLYDEMYVIELLSVKNILKREVE